MSNDNLLILSALGDAAARQERFVREVMLIDRLSWDEASAHVGQMAARTVNEHHAQAASTVVGVASVAIGIASVPLVFSREVACAFNDAFVTTPMPGAEDLETPLEVAIWTWGWMEPPIGTISFVFICLQFARGRGIQNPVESSLRRRREEALLRRYSRYSPLIVLQWAEALSPGQDYFSSDPERLLPPQKPS